MKTTSELLPAINDLYSFKFSEKQIYNLVNTMPILRQRASDLNFTDLDDDLDPHQSVWNNLCTITRKKDTILIKTFNQHKHDVQVEPLKQQTLTYDRAEKIIQSGQQRFMWFPFYSVPSEAIIQHYYSHFITFDKITPKDVITLAGISYFFDTVTSGQETLLKDCLSTSSEHKHYPTVSNFKSAVLKNFKSKYEYFNQNAERVCISNLPQINYFLKELLPEDVLVTSYQNTEEDLKQINKKCFHLIQSVIEWDNYRLAISRIWNYRYNQNTDFFVFSLTPHTNEVYNYIDIKRWWIPTSHRMYGYNNTNNRPFGVAMLTADEPEFLQPDVIRNFVDNHSGKTQLLDNGQLRLIAKRYLQTQARKKKKEQDAQQLKQKVKDKLEKLLTTTGSIKINDVTYTKSSIEYHNQKLTVEGCLHCAKVSDTWVYHLLKTQTQAFALHTITFDHIFDAYVDRTSPDQVGELQYTSGTIGSVSYNVTYTTTTNKNNVSSTLWSINGNRINAKEIQECVRRAICFETQDDFDHFLKSVSKCSLKVHRYLQLGIDIDVHDPFDNTSVQMKFPIDRYKNINYLVLNDEEYRIRDTEAIIRLQKAPDILHVITALLSGDVVTGISTDDIKPIIKSGKVAYKDAVTKSEELLTHAEKLLKINKEKIEMANGTSFYGYRIKGNLRNYLVNAEDARHSVYDADTGGYICIVDKTTSAQVGMDRLVNRLFALSNDERVAKKITTLQRRS